MTLKIISVVGARPNFIKIAPFIKAINEYNKTNPKQQIENLLIHTGQHYDIRMSEAFFKELNIPAPDINLEVGSGSHAEQVGQTMIAFEKVLIEHKPDWVVVVGDVNATLACSVTAKKMNIKVCHIEAGLRSGDMKMPEEINRLVTDRLSDLLLTPDRLSSENLRKEGVAEDKIVFVGNIMIDTLEQNLKKALGLNIDELIKNNLIPDSNILYKINENAFAVMTLHRPSNVDSREVFVPLIEFIIDEVTKDFTMLWPIHPRAKNSLKKFNLWERVKCNKNIVLMEPIGYHEMLRLNYSAKIMLTDSGGLQEECCVLGTPCLTLRWNTERPITLKEHGGVSVLVGNNIERIRKEYNNTLASKRIPSRPELWDGKTAERCLHAIINVT